MLKEAEVFQRFVQWHDGEALYAKNQGWQLTPMYDGEYFVHLVNDPRPSSTVKAEELVANLAISGDRVAIKALYMVGHKMTKRKFGRKYYHGIFDGLPQFRGDMSERVNMVQINDLLNVKLEQKIDQLEDELNRLDPDRYNYAKGM